MKIYLSKPNPHENGVLLATHEYLDKDNCLGLYFDNCPRTHGKENNMNQRYQTEVVVEISSCER